MSYQEIKDKIGILEAKMQELWELILAFDDDPIQRAEYINELADYSLRKKKLENSLTN
jgi:hypothetical protein